MLRALVAVAVALAIAPAAIAEGVHEHGSGKLLVAIDGPVLEAQLEAPADDIVGFEHTPRTEADRAAVSAAVALLEDGDEMIGPAVAAGCALQESSVSSPLIEGDGHGDHAEFVATYRFECTNPDALTGLETNYFRAFPRARELDVVVLSERGQAAGELTADETGFSF